MRIVTCARVFIVSSVCISALRAQAPRDFSGTYAIWLCGPDCSVTDTAKADVAGFLVLSRTQLDTAQFPLRFREPLSGSSSDTPNACFSFTRSNPQKFMAGNIRFAITTWRMRGDSVGVGLYASPDAFSRLVALIRNGELTGVHHESAVIGRVTDRDVGRAYGRRIGDPDILKCLPS